MASNPIKPSKKKSTSLFIAFNFYSYIKMEKLLPSFASLQ